jgi:aconitate hydratase
MGGSLTEQIWDGHRAARAAARARTAERGLSADHFVLSGRAGRLTLRALGSTRARAEPMLMALEGLTSPTLAPRHLIEAATRAHALGARVCRPGRGGADRVYRERLAAPGRLAFAVGGGLPTASALGGLDLEVDALEAAEALAGEPLWRPPPAVMAVRLEGGWPAWVGGADLALVLLRDRAILGMAGAGLEVSGAGVAAVPIGDRLLAAFHVRSLGAASLVFPSDERTRRFLASRRREADWKALAAGADAPPVDRVVELDAIEPLIAPEGEPLQARAVRHAMGLPIHRIVVGARATLADWAKVAHALSGAAVDPRTRLVLVAPGPERIKAAEIAGLLAPLTQAGVVIAGGGLPAEIGAASDAAAAGLYTASDGEHRSGRRMRWHLVSLETCVAAALSGELVDPRVLEERLAEAGESELADPDSVIESRAEAPAAGSAPGFSAAPLERPIRGAVLLASGARVPAAAILALGPVNEPYADDPAALTAWLFAGSGDFAGAARRHRGGFVVAGEGFGAGEPAELAALTLGAAGVRAVLARSFAAGFEARLVRAGVLPLVLERDPHGAILREGDELELPGLPGALEPGKPLTVRNLTRGSQCTVAHRLELRAIERLRAGRAAALELA